MRKIISLAIVLVATLAMAGKGKLDLNLNQELAGRFYNVNYGFEGKKGVFLGYYLGWPTVSMTTNGGIAWTDIQNGMYNQFSAANIHPEMLNVAEINDDTIICAGKNGLMVKTVNNGVNWSINKTDGGDAQDYISSASANANVVAFLTAKGNLVTNPNAGNESNENDVLDVDFNKTNDANSVAGWILIDGNIVGSYDVAKNSWRYAEESTLPSWFKPKAICHIPSDPKNNIIVVGENGQTMRSFNGGISWQSISTPAIGYTLDDIHFEDSQIGYAIGSKNFSSMKKSVLLKTTDAGNTWTIIKAQGMYYAWKGFKIAKRTGDFTGTPLSQQMNFSGGHMADIYAWTTEVNENLQMHDASNITSSPHVYSSSSYGDLGLVYSDYIPNQDIIQPAPAAITETTTIQNLTVSGNYPNPFNPETAIRFSLPKSDVVKVSVMNVQGQVIAVLANQQFNAGENQIKWNAVNQTSGLYFYKISTSTESITKQMLLTK